MLAASDPAKTPRYDRATEMNLIPEEPYKLVDVSAVEVLKHHVVRLRFSDGCEGVLDLGPLLWGPIFEPIVGDYDAFLQIAVDPETGTIGWPNGADLAPEVLHAEAVKACPAPA